MRCPNFRPLFPSLFRAALVTIAGVLCFQATPVVRAKPAAPVVALAETLTQAE